MTKLVAVDPWEMLERWASPTGSGPSSPSKCADIVVHDGRRPEWHPLHDPVASLVYAARTRSVHDVLTDGRFVLEGGEFTTIDEGAAYPAIDPQRGEPVPPHGLGSVRHHHSGSPRNAT